MHAVVACSSIRHYWPAGGHDTAPAGNSQHATFLAAGVVFKAPTVDILCTRVSNGIRAQARVTQQRHNGLWVLHVPNSRPQKLDVLHGANDASGEHEG